MRVRNISEIPLIYKILSRRNSSLGVGWDLDARTYKFYRLHIDSYSIHTVWSHALRPLLAAVNNNGRDHNPSSNIHCAINDLYNLVVPMQLDAFHNPHKPYSYKMQIKLWLMTNCPASSSTIFSISPASNPTYSLYPCRVLHWNSLSWSMWGAG
jgi:hypothetical protein